MGLWQRFKNFVKRTFSGGGGGSSRRVSNNRDSRSVVSSNTRSYGSGSSVRRSYYNALRNERDDLKRKSSSSWEKTRNAFKASSSKATADPKIAQREKAKKDTRDYFKADAPVRQKGTPVDVKEQRNKNEGIAKAIKRGEKKATANAYKPIVDERYFSGTKEAKRRLKSGEYQSDPDVAIYEMAKHPTATSLARGGVSGASLGLSELLAKKAPKSKEMARAEKYYQENKNKAAELAGEVGASLLSFGLTSGASKAAVGKVAPKATAKVGAKATEKLATKEFIKNAARKELGKEATEEAIAELAKKKAGQIVSALGEDAAINLTTGAVSDVAHSLADSKNLKEFGKNMAGNVVLNTVVGGGAAAAPALRRATKPYVDEAAEAAGRKLKSEAGKVDIGSRLKKLTEERDELQAILKRDEDIISELDYDKITKRIAKLDDEISSISTKAEPPKVKIERNRKRRTDVILPNERRAATNAVDETGVVLRGEASESARAGEFTGANERVGATENAGAGERTTFRRSEEKTAKEKARERRTTGNKENVTQETFDRDFEAFTQKVAKASDLKSRMNAASSKEEKAALQAQLDELNAEIRKDYSKASLRYHPDRGGTNEWMGQFNNAFTEHRRGTFSGAYKKDGFSGASYSQRARTDAGAEAGTNAGRGNSWYERYRANEQRRAAEAGGSGNGTTPPPPRGGTAEGAENAGRGFRKPKGKATRTVNSVEDMVFKSREKRSLRDDIVDLANSVKTKFVDSLNAFEEENRRFLHSDNKRWNENRGAINKVRSFKAIAGRAIGNAQLNWKGERFSGTVTRNGHTFENGKSLAEIFGDMDKDTEAAFNAYLLLKHAPDRLREGKPVFDNVELRELGVNLNDPEVCLAEAEKRLKEHPEFAAKAEEVYQYIENELQNRVDAGLLSQEVADEWAKKYPYYVPTGREGFFNGVHGDSSGVTGAGELNTATGSSRNIMDIKQQLADATTRNWRDMSVNNLFRKMFGDRVADDLAKEADGGIEKVLDNTIGLSKTKGEGGKYYANIFVDGEKKSVEIEKRFYDAMEDMYKNGRLGNGLDTATDIASKVSNVWKSLITEWSPIFMVKNFLRDFPEAVINTKQTKEFLESMGPAIKDLLNDGPYSQALRDAGISQSTFIDIDKALTKDKNFMSRANELTEMLPRLAEYMATFKKAGVDLADPSTYRSMSPEDFIALRDMAAANAADVTVNFGRNGSVGKMLNRGFVPFFNPSVQGWSKFVRNVTELNGSKEALSFALKAGALGVGASTINNLMLKDNPNYQIISPRDKANNYIFAVGDRNTTDTFIKIPRSRFAAVYGLPLTNAFNDNKMGFAEMIKTMNDQVAPIDPIENTLWSPFLDVAKSKEGETWYGTPIVPQALADLHPSQQYDANTSAIGKALGKATASLPDELQISPKKADYVADAMTGVIGDFVLPALTPSRQGGGSGPGKYLAPLANVPKRAFTIDSVTQNNLSTRFYDQLGMANADKKSPDATEADAEEYKRLNAYSTEISDVNTAIRDLQNGNRATKQDDIRGLQKVRNQMMLSALDGKGVPPKSKTLDAVQKYVGTSYAINNFGSSADKKAMEAYGLKKYGAYSDAEREKMIDNDKSFYGGVRAIGRLEDKLSKADLKGGTTTLAKAVALADANADDDLFGAYKATKKSRTESDNKMNRARTYMQSGGSTDEFVKLETARKTLGKLKDFDKESELAKAKKQMASGEMSYADYHTKLGQIEYNANISYVGLATSLAQANAPGRGYKLYDIKDRNIQKGINIAAMGYTARDYSEMAKAVDSDGNGYPSKAEITAYVADSGVEDKATLFDALCYYPNSRNPFGSPTMYTRDQAAAAGRKNGVKAISNETGDLGLDLSGSGSTSKSGYGRRRGYRRRGYSRGGGSSKTVKTSVPIKASDYKASKGTYKDMASALKPRSTSKSKSTKTTTATTKIAPPKVKFKKYTI